MSNLATSEKNMIDPCRVLIVDDDSLVLESFERLFLESQEEFKIEKTSDSREALKLIQGKRYDIIITDLVMPEIDGIQVLQKAKEIQPDTQVILITAYSSYNSAVDAMYFGASDYITKPINLSEFRNRVQRAINKRKSILEKNNKIQEMEELYYTVIHDLKSMLIAVKAFAGMLYKDHFDKLRDEEGKFLLTRVNTNIKNMEVIIEKLLEYSRVGKLKEEWYNIDTDELVHDIADNFSIILKENGIDLIIESPLPSVYFYESGLRSIFSNLIENAVKYSRGGVESYIKIGTVAPREDYPVRYHIFYIEDNGIGIDPKSFQHIFEFFHRGEKISDERGYGIGLALVKKILQSANCTITVESRANERTIFRFSLPVALK
ncbi:MAG: response regulator [Spirochaetota bacterium]